MNLRTKLWAGGLGLVLLLTANPTTPAQDFGLKATASPDPVVVNHPILYFIDVTNTFGFSITDVFVTNAIPHSAIVNAATNSEFGTIYTNSVGVVFRINTFIGGAVARLTLSLTPVVAGSFTNQITVAALNRTSATTNVITQVLFPSADLAVGMTNSTSGVLTNDATVIGLWVTNLGPNSASGVVVSNRLPASFKLLSVAPAGVNYTFNGGDLALNLGTLASGSSTQLLVSVQPTNAGTFNLSAAVSASDILDPNPLNSGVTNNLIVSGFLEADLAVTVMSQQFNRQTGLLEMAVRLTNNGATNVPAARLIVSGLTNGTWLYNAVGTNTAGAYALYNAPLAGGGSMDLLLEFYVLTRGPLTSYNLQPVAVPAINLTAPTNSGTTITNHVLSSGGFLIEFPATPGAIYTIVYSDNLSFSNALTAQPSIVAPANRVQWIDNGPPKTISHPSNTIARFYRVFQAP